MKIPNMILLRIGLVCLTIMANMAMADDLSQQYCSSENTGSDFTPGEWNHPRRQPSSEVDLRADNSIYMSNGKCFDYCQADYAFAIVQWKNCWCSNYIPRDQQSTGNCNQQCPGYPGDLCGNQGQGLYGYIALSKAPSGTAGAISSAQPTSAQPTSSPPVSPNITVPIRHDVPLSQTRLYVILNHSETTSQVTITNCWT